MERDLIINLIMDCILIFYAMILYIYNKCFKKKDYLSFKTFADNSKSLFNHELSISMTNSDQNAINEKDENNQLENLI